MWLGRDAIRLDRLRDFLNENAHSGETLTISAPNKKLITPEAGSFAIRKPSLFRGMSSPQIIFQCDSKREAPCTVVELQAAITKLLTEDGESEIVVKISTGGKLYQLRGDVKVDLEEDSPVGTCALFLTSSAVIPQVFEEPPDWMNTRSLSPINSAEAEAPTYSAPAEPDDEEYPESNMGVDAWSTSWKDAWREDEEIDWEENWEDEEELEPEPDEEDEPEADEEASEDKEPETDEDTDEDDEPESDEDEADEDADVDSDDDNDSDEAEEEDVDETDDEDEDESDSEPVTDEEPDQESDDGTEAEEEESEAESPNEDESDSEPVTDEEEPVDEAEDDSETDDEPEDDEDEDEEDDEYVYHGKHAKHSD